MFAAIAQLMPAAGRMSRQIVPPVIATLIAAGLISAYNRAFSGHLSQPRMSALHAEDSGASTAPVTTVARTREPAAPVTEIITIYEEAAATERLWDKDATEEAGKDQSAVKMAADSAPPPVRIAVQAPRPEPKPEAKQEPRRYAAIEPAPAVEAVPVIVAAPPSVVSPPATAPMVAALPPAQEQRGPYDPRYRAPPPVIVGQPSMVTVPDRPNTRPPEEAQVAPAPPESAMGKFVNALKPSTWFARAREFGDKIEQAGNDILPSIRQ